jgi:hypothetical protein
MLDKSIKVLVSAVFASSISLFNGLAAPAVDSSVWPNTISNANSDEWLVRNHDKIQVLKPNVLVLNFANGYSTDDVKKCATKFADALREASRFHGYKQSTNPALDYQIYKVVDFADDHNNKSGVGGESSKYPRRPETGNFSYPRLFSNEFVGQYDVRDPRTGAQLALGEMVKQGLVHEVWIITSGDEARPPAESAEYKQAYDDHFNKISNTFVRAGSGGDAKGSNIGRSLRFIGINITKGAGCALESYGHSIEGLADSNAVPYFKKFFNEYADFDLESRYKLPFNTLYSRHGATLNYPDPTTLEVMYDRRRIVVHGYVPRGNSVHFTINSRKDMDMDNPQPVMSTIEHYRQHDGLRGADKSEMWTPAVLQKYKASTPDCMGPWVTYWMQNFPGPDNRASDDEGHHMKSWWPFLFY